MEELVLAPTKSRIRIRTFAEGLLARLAHDVELTCKAMSGRATRSDGAKAAGSAAIEIPIAGIEVVGVLSGGGVDESGLSRGERHDLLEKMRRDVFHAGGSAVVRVEATLEGDSARVRIMPPNGRAVERTVRPSVAEEADGAIRAQGTIEVSLSALGSATVKGPMNAFRVKDRVEVLFDVVFARASAHGP